MIYSFDSGNFKGLKLWGIKAFFKIYFDLKQVSYENSNKLNKYPAKGGGKVCG